MEVYDEDGSISYSKENVLSKWESEFSQLFNKVKACENSNFDNDFYDEVLNFKNELEQQCNTETPENVVTNNNDILNSHISFNEISSACLNGRNGKSTSDTSECI